MFSGIAQTLCEELKKLYPFQDTLQSDDQPSEQAIDDALAEIHHNRGVIAVEINKPREALEHLQKFNGMMLKELGDRPPGTDMRLALSFNELGCAYMLRDDYSQAEDCWNKCVSSIEQLENYQNEKWQGSLPSVNLGAVYWLTGRYSEALDVLLQGLRERERKYGYNDRESFM